MAGIGFDELAFGEVGSFGGILHQCVLVLEYLGTWFLGLSSLIVYVVYLL